MVLNVETSDLRLTSAHAADVGQRAKTGTSAAIALIAAYAGCWGDDDIGEAFSSAYVPSAGTVMDELLDVAPRIGELAQSLDQAAGMYDATEDTNTANATQAGTVDV